MTIAICFRCGEFKFGAFIPCRKCGAFPNGDEESALSVALSDHHHDRAQLEKIAEQIQRGATPELDPETKERLVAEMRGSGQSQILAGLQAQLRRFAEASQRGGVEKPPSSEDASQS